MKIIIVDHFIFVFNFERTELLEVITLQAFEYHKHLAIKHNGNNLMT